MVVTTVCFPRDDDAFVEQVRELVGIARKDAPLQAAIEALLRETYPLAVIHPRQSIAAFDGAVVWYVFRDGGVTGPSGDLS